MARTAADRAYQNNLPESAPEPKPYNGPGYKIVNGTFEFLAIREPIDVANSSSASSMAKDDQRPRKLTKAPSRQIITAPQEEKTYRPYCAAETGNSTCNISADIPKRSWCSCITTLLSRLSSMYWPLWRWIRTHVMKEKEIEDDEPDWGDWKTGITVTRKVDIDVKRQ